MLKGYNHSDCSFTLFHYSLSPVKFYLEYRDFVVVVVEKKEKTELFSLIFYFQ